MSNETVPPPPPDGPKGAGLDPRQETCPLLSNRHDERERRTSESATLLKARPARGHVTEEEEEGPNRCQPVRTQPHPSGSSGRGGGQAANSPNGPSSDTAVTAPHTCSCGASLDANHVGGQTSATRTTSTSTATMTEQPGRHLTPTTPTTPVSQKMQQKLRSSLSVNSDGSRRSRSSSTGSQKPPLPEDCCVHCILACLFCEFLALCNMVATQASCGACTLDACCCCCADDLGDDCNCPCDDMDCGIMDACCESSDCLEICMECCGICFPT